MTEKILSPAQRVFAQEGAQKIPLKIAALISIRGSDRIRALVWRGEAKICKGMSVFDETHSKRSIGSTIPIGDILPKAKWLDPLFSVLELTPEVSNEIKSSLRKAAISKDVSENIFGPRAMRVRHLNLSPSGSKSRKKYKGSNTPPQFLGTPGYLTGDVTDHLVKMAGVEVTIDRAALAKGRGRREFAGRADGGLPVISSSGALLGFIIAIGKDGTVILPAEDIESALDANFLTPSRRSLGQGPSIRPRRAEAA